jgi:hypothetical protein
MGKFDLEELLTPLATSMGMQGRKDLLLGSSTIKCAELIKAAIGAGRAGIRIYVEVHGTGLARPGAAADLDPACA